MKITHSIFIILSTFSLLSFTHVENKDRAVSIYQDNINQELDAEVQTIHLHRTSFSIRYYNEISKATQIAVSTDKKFLKTIELGMSPSETTCFAPGTGMAASEEGYTSLVFNENAHHYLFYDDEQTNRARLMSNYGNYLRFEFTINSFTIEGKEYKIYKTPIDKFYMMIFIDINSNNIIEEGELNKVIVQFD